MKRLAILAAGVLLVLTLALAQTQDKKPQNSNKTEPQSSTPNPSQEAHIVAPQAYKLGFENARVRVTRVHYEPREIIKSHEHPKLPTIYVYLNESGPVRFTHTGDEKFILTRPLVKAGAFRLSRGGNETHEVENLSDQPSDFLRIELKDLAVDKDTFRARFPPEKNPPTENSEKNEFENAQLRIARVTCASRKGCSLNAQTSPYLLVALTSSQLKTAINDAAFSNLKMDLGQTIWVESNERRKIENVNDSPVRFLRIEFKAAG